MGFPWGLNAGWNASALHKSIVDSPLDRSVELGIEFFPKLAAGHARLLWPALKLSNVAKRRHAAFAAALRGKFRARTRRMPEQKTAISARARIGGVE
jgi:hypothetical protein